MRTSKILLVAVCVTLLAGLLADAPALAHTEIVGKTPDEGATLDRAPRQVQLSFARPVEAEFSPLEVYDEQDRRVDLDDARLNPDDATVLTVGLRKDLPAGSYTVEYRFTGEDGHTITGAYEFAVARQAKDTPEEKSSAPRAVSNEDAQQDPAPVERAGREEDGSASVALYVGLGVVGLTVIGMLVLRRR